MQSAHSQIRRATFGIKVQSFSDFLNSLGNLHDCTIRKFVWSGEGKSVQIHFDDLMFNFEGLPEYRGPVSGTISLNGVQHVHFDLDWSEKSLWVFDFTTETIEGGAQKAILLFVPSGKLEVVFSEASFPNLQIPESQYL